MEEMIRFVTGVTNLVREKFCMAMLHDDLTLDRIMVCTLSIEEYKLCRNSKRSGSNDLSQPRFKKKVELKKNLGVLR